MTVREFIKKGIIVPSEIDVTIFHLTSEERYNLNLSVDIDKSYYKLDVDYSLPSDLYGWDFHGMSFIGNRIIIYCL